MQFTSFTFAVFFPVVVLIFYILPKKARQIWLLLASYCFYMGWNPKYALLILTSTVITYLCGLGIDMFSAEKKRVRKAVLLAGILSNLGILVFFKYFYFLHDSVAAVVSIFGIHMKASKLQFFKIGCHLQKMTNLILWFGLLEQSTRCINLINIRRHTNFQ